MAFVNYYEELLRENYDCFGEDDLKVFESMGVDVERIAEEEGY